MRVETKVARACTAPGRAFEKASVGQREKAREILDDARAVAAEAREELNARLLELDAAGAAISAALEGLDMDGALACSAAMHTAVARLEAKLERLAQGDVE